MLEFIHITDTHILDNPEATFHGIKTAATLEAVLIDAVNQYPNLDFILHTGDVSQTGNVESYQIFKSIIQKFAVPLYCIPGNHDAPESLKKIYAHCPDESIKIVKLNDISLVLISSYIENEHYGLISNKNLLELKQHLSKYNNQFNVIAVHHSPIHLNVDWLDKLALTNKYELLKIIQTHSDSTVLFFGHIHREIDQAHGNIRVISTPSTCHQFDENEMQMNCIHYPPPAYRYVKLSAEAIEETKIHYIERVNS